MAKKRSKPAPPPSPPEFPADLLGRVHHADCMTRLPTIPDASVDVVFADPPFNIGYAYDEHDDAMAPGAYLAWCASWLEHAARVLKPTGSLWLAISAEYASELKILAEGRYFLAWGKADDPLPLDYDRVIRRKGPPLHRIHSVQWYYTFGVNCARKLSRSHTTLFHFARSESGYAWHPEDPAVRVPSARALVYKDRRANPAGRLPDDTWVLRPQELPAGFQAAGDDVWHDNRVCGTYKEKRETSNQMPEAILERVIRLSTAPGDLVLDPFAGSGTTPAVAKRLGRRFVAFEKAERAATVAADRVAAVQGPAPAGEVAS